MTSFEPQPNPDASEPRRGGEDAEYPPVVVGEPLPGLIGSSRRLPEGMSYWDQVIPSSLGTLYYSPQQTGDMRHRWVTTHGDTLVLVEIDTGVVVSVDTDALSARGTLESYD